MSNNTDSDYNDFLKMIQSSEESSNNIRMSLIVVYSIVCILGLTLNTWVAISACCLFQKRRKPAGATVWVLGLAVTHLVCLAFLPLQLLYAWSHFNWHYEAVTCKFASYGFYFSFFTTATMLSLWSVSHCIRSVACFKSNVDITMVLLSLTLGATLALPSLFSRELRYTLQGRQCIDDFDFDDNRSTNEGEFKLLIVILSRFLLGIALPAFVVGISCCLKRRDPWDYSGRVLRKILQYIKMAHFICWTPLIFMSIIQYAKGNYKVFDYGLPLATALASVHCCINPVIYLLVRSDFKMTWMSPPTHAQHERADSPMPLDGPTEMSKENEELLLNKRKV